MWLLFFKWLVEQIHPPFTATTYCTEQLWPSVLLGKCLSGEEWHVDWDDSSVRSSVRHMAIGDEMWRLVAAMLVTYSMSTAVWPRWCCADGLTGSAFLPQNNTDSHTWYFLLRILHHKPLIIGHFYFMGQVNNKAYTSTPIYAIPIIKIVIMLIFRCFQFVPLDNNAMVFEQDVSFMCKLPFNDIASFSMER